MQNMRKTLEDLLLKGNQETVSMGQNQLKNEETREFTFRQLVEEMSHKIFSIEPLRKHGRIRNVIGRNEERFKVQILKRVNLSDNMTCSSAAIVVQCIKNIEKMLNQSQPYRYEDISQELSILKGELDKELPLRVRAGKEGLYPLLIKCLKVMEPNYLLQVLETLTSLTNGYSDLLDKDGLEFMMAFLHDNVDLELIIQNLKWIKNCVTGSERNRIELISMRIQDSFRHLLQEFRYKARLVTEICQVTRKLVSDDDIHAIYGNPYEHARDLANETLCLFVSFLDIYGRDVCVLLEIIATITVLLVRDEFCIKVYEQNGLRYIFDAMVNYAENEKINRQCLCLLRGLAGSDYVKEPIIQNGAAHLIIATMYRHKGSSPLVAAGCVCISALTLRSRSNAQAFVDAGCPELLMIVLNMYRDNPVILKNGCWAIRNIVSRSPEFRQKFTVLGVEAFLNETRKKFEKELEYETKVTLRDLGCEVEEE